MSEWQVAATCTLKTVAFAFLGIQPHQDVTKGKLYGTPTLHLHFGQDRYQVAQHFAVVAINLRTVLCKKVPCQIYRVVWPIYRKLRADLPAQALIARSQAILMVAPGDDAKLTMMMKMPEDLKRRGPLRCRMCRRAATQ